MPNPNLLKSSARPLFGALFLAILLLGGTTSPSRAQVIITSSAPFNIGTGVYTYSYSVLNNGTLDLAIVTIPVDFNSNLMNLTAPSGFLISFDPGSDPSGPGLVSFLEDNLSETTATFSPGSNVGGFSFTSLLAPAPVTFSAFDTNATEFTGTTQAPIPEPTSALLLLSGFALLGRGLMFRHRAAKSLV